jgi:hypothetical protein
MTFPTQNIQERDSNAFVPLDYVVRSFMNERQDFNLDNFEPYLQIIREGYMTLNIHRIRTIRPYYTTVSEANIAALPPDYIDYNRIGIIFDGKIWELGYNPDINLPRNEVCGVTVGNPDNLSAIPSPYWYEPTYGGGYNIGKYRIDEERRVIIFDGDMASKEICIEYVSTGMSITSKTYVPRVVIPVLKAYLNWIIVERNEKKGIGQSMRAEQLYNRALIEFNVFKNKFTIQEFMDALRSGYTRGVKR